MIDINELRQSLGAVQPEEVSELLDRLEAAEKDVALKERVIYALRLELNAVAKERDILSAELSKQQTLTVAAQHIAEVAQIRANQLQAKIEAAEKERGIDEQRIADLMEELNRVGHENDALRSKIEHMEKQEPVVEVQWAAGIPNSFLDFISTDGYLPKLGDKLYALPGAKGEEK